MGQCETANEDRCCWWETPLLVPSKNLGVLVVARPASHQEFEHTVRCCYSCPLRGRLTSSVSISSNVVAPHHIWGILWPFRTQSILDSMFNIFTGCFSDGYK